jgi:hypothetical protein
VLAEQKSDDSELVDARGTFVVVIRVVAATAFVLVAGFTFGASWIATKIVDAGVPQQLATAGILAVLCAPVMLVSLRLVLARVSDADAVADARQVRLDAEGQHREQ